MYLELVVGHIDVRPTPRGSESKNEVEKGWEKVMSNSAQESDSSDYASEPVGIHSFIPQISLDQCSYRMLLGTRDSRVKR